MWKKCDKKENLKHQQLNQESLPGDNIFLRFQKHRRSTIWSQRCSFVFIFSDEHQKVLPVSHQQKCSINGICGTFDIKSNYFGPVIPRKLKKV